MKNKVGSIFLVSMLALAGLGVSYAGFFDEITVFGTVNTGTVEFSVTGYSFTEVWKDLTTNEVVIVPPAAPPNPGMLVAYAKAYAKDGQVYMEWDNIFPCIDFMADVEIEYTGSIPAHVTIEDLVWISGNQLAPYLTFKFFKDVNGGWVQFGPNEIVQVHKNDDIRIEATIHLPQLNILQGITNGAFNFKIHAIQWYDPPCNP